MNKKLVVILVLGLISNNILACDLCTIYLGIQPNDFKNSFVVRHRYRLFEREFQNNEHSYTISSGQRIKGETKDKHVGLPDNTGATGTYNYAESFHSYDVVANFFVGQKLQINSSISFADNYVYLNDSIAKNVSGIGDFNLLLKYQIFNSIKKDDSLTADKLIHRIMSIVGVILPTGSYNKSTITGFETEFKPNTIIGTPITYLDPHLQAGTGSFGYLLSAEYYARLNQGGFNLNISYRLNSTNKNGFKFANRFNTNASFFILTKIGKHIKLMPKMGISYEHSKRDYYENEPFIDSGGEALFLNYGVNLFVNKLGIAFTYYQPKSESLMGIQPNNKRRIITQLAYYF